MIKIKSYKKSIVCILGAGASSVFGYPLQKNLWNFLIHNKLRDDERFLEKFRLKYGENVEEAITLINTAIDNRDINIVYEDMPREDLGRFQELLIKSFSEFKISKKGIQIYKALISKLKDFQKVTFINLNWDTGLEKVLEKMSIGVYYGLIFDRDPNSSYFDTQISLEKSSSKEVNKKIKTIQVLKPHGSMNWIFCPACKKLYCHRYGFNIFSLRKEVIEKVEKYYQTKNNCKLCSNWPEFNSWLARPVIGLPSFLKKTDFNYFNAVSRRTHQVLTNADILMFIGYSFREADWDIKYILKSAINFRSNSCYPYKSLEVIVVDNKEVKDKIYNFFNPPIYRNESIENINVKHIGYLNSQNIQKIIKYLEV